jgi:hypothetical protein
MLEKHGTTILTIEDKAKQETSMKAGGKQSKINLVPK